MLAYRLLHAQTPPEFQEVPEPHPGPGQVVVSVAGSGLCHTDFAVISRERSYWREEAPPFTLGHEIAGWIEEVGAGVTKFRPGDAVAVNPSWASCGHCHMCRSGEENHCLFQKAIRAPGVGHDGGHAPYVLVPDARFLVPIGDLDPVVAAPLTDAGITTYSAIKPMVPAIWPGSTAVVIGVGGLGIYAVQFLRLLTGAQVVAVDSTEARLKLAREYGADEVVVSGPDAAHRIRELSGGVGAAFVLDCVGVNATLATGVAALSWRGRLTMVGAGGGSVPFDFFKVPPGSQLTTSLNGGSIALMEVVGLAAMGRLKVLVDRYPLSAAKQAYDDFEHGRLVGRAVLMPAPKETGATESYRTSLVPRRDGNGWSVDPVHSTNRIRKEATMATTMTAEERAKAGAQKVQELRDMFADAPELGKKALENVLGQINSQASDGTAPPVESAGRAGLRVGKVSELTMIVPLIPGGAERLRAFLTLVGGNLRYGGDLVGTLHDMRFVFFDNDTRLLFATAFDGDWDTYIDDFVTKIPDFLDLMDSSWEGWPGIRSPQAKDYILRHQVNASGWYVAHPDLTVAEIHRLKRLGKAVDEFLDKVSE